MEHFWVVAIILNVGLQKTIDNKKTEYVGIGNAKLGNNNESSVIIRFAG